MSRLRLFTVFHGNLDFSALPDRDLPSVVTRCYWPLLALAGEARIPLGIEMPARTLARVAREDPEWMKTFRELAERGLVEPVASGLAQVVGPLVPADVNRENLALGREAYAALLGFVPTTWFVNEQTFASGLVDLYGEAGARALVVEWNNPASQRPELRPLRHRPAHLALADGTRLALLWNDSVVFQKLQRAVHGDTPASDYLDAVLAARGEGAPRALCAYGGDLEIFDYRPGRPAPAGAERGTEMARLSGLLRGLAARGDVVFRLPRDVWGGGEAGPPVLLTAAAEPVPCKKQPRYNPTRWAVAGRDGVGLNTRCFALRRSLAAEAGLEGDPARLGAARRDLVELWGSDFRTRATEERLTAFHARMGMAEARSRSRLERAVPRLAEGCDVLLANASGADWCGQPVEVPLHLAPGRLANLAVVAEPPGVLPEDAVQLEVHGRYRDGSVRRAVLVLEPRLAAGATATLRFVPAPAAAAPRAPDCPGRLDTGAVRVELWHHRGGALAALGFPALSDRPLLGTVPHGTYEDIAYTPDFYSGHVVAVTEAGTKLTDLRRSDAWAVHEGPLRTTVGFRVKTPVGDWTKLYRLYRHHPRLDLVHGLAFHEARLVQLRLGTVTALPGALDRASLGYATVNGGREAERFALPADVRVAQHEPVPGATSARSCLGATEGWVSLGDGRRGVAVVGDRSQAAAVPLLEFADVDDRFFLRLHHTLAENDETQASFFRGFRRAAFALVGHADDTEAVRACARGIERGLVYRTEQGVGVARGV